MTTKRPDRCEAGRRKLRRARIRCTASSSGRGVGGALGDRAGPGLRHARVVRIPGWPATTSRRRARQGLRAPIGRRTPAPQSVARCLHRNRQGRRHPWSLTGHSGRTRLGLCRPPTPRADPPGGRPVESAEHRLFAGRVNDGTHTASAGPSPMKRTSARSPSWSVFERRTRISSPTRRRRRAPHRQRGAPGADPEHRGASVPPIPWRGAPFPELQPSATTCDTPARCLSGRPMSGRP